MKMNKVEGLLLILIVAILSSCGSAKRYTSTLVGGDYDAAKDITSYMVFPYGQVNLPGKWEKGAYNNIARQQFFHNQDSVIVAVSFGPCDKYEFNKDGVLKGYEFVEAFYKWDSDYFISNGLESKLLESDKSKNCILYRVFGKGFDTYFLIGEKNGMANNYSIQATDKWTENEKIQFLKSLF
jgi:hypothetical protein